MNDSKNSSKGLLVISSQASLKSEQLGMLRQLVEPMADELDLTPVALCDGLEVRAVIDYLPLLTRLCVAMEALVAQGAAQDGFAPNVAENAPQALNARPTGLNSHG